MLALVLLVFCLVETDSAVDSYVAAVYEHRVILNPDPRVPVSRRDALIHMQKNLDIYEEQAARAALQGAQILVFPEDGIHGFNFTRSSISGYLETIPDPEQESWNPCAEPGRYNNTEGVRQLIFPTAWMNALPLLDSIQFHRAFSLGANVTVLSANTRNDRLIMTGSGIFTPFSATFHHALKDDPEEGRLLVARVPVLDPMGVDDVAESTSSVPTESAYCDKESCAASSSPQSSYPTFTAFMMHDPFKFVLINEAEGNLTVCDGTFCCHLQYKWIAHDERKELYALGAFAGLHTVNGRYALQVGMVHLNKSESVRCAGLEASSCGQEVEEAESKMDFLLEATFQTEYVYPSVLVNRMVLEQPEKLEKAAGGRVAMKHSKLSGGLITACLYGRMYHLDNE
ncbi:hypothetical protein XENOCAPTIV_008438 [Xenoophorus captivus]|uniref:Vanin C-terminal domain-containing protein n=1 Tax=Xenoophorus captivus TaxID=1517983 RepID=A0ABV0RG95_9TELE